MTADTAQRPRSVAARLLIGLVGVYQAARAGRPSPCRYDPSCSAYARTALERFGAARGTWLAARRLLRCHPWGGFGPDPVPDLPTLGAEPSALQGRSGPGPSALEGRSGRSSPSPSRPPRPHR